MEYGIIAEASNSFMGQFVYAGLALLAGLASGAGIMVAIRKPAPTQIEQPISTQINGEVNVRTLDKLATREFVTARHVEVERRLSGHDDEIAEIRSEMKDDRKNNEAHASARSKTIFDEIGKVRTELSKKIDDMPSKIIADLRNAKGLLND